MTAKERKAVRYLGHAIDYLEAPSKRRCAMYIMDGALVSVTDIASPRDAAIAILADSMRCSRSTGSCVIADSAPVRWGRR
jgi:hypothetical protein